jgi:uncharacterized protein with NAD-binding domain and iron-sulfur cluster
VKALRPGPRTSIAGLLLAGAWTDTGWPATLEGAVLSGHAAASAALSKLEIDGAAVGSPQARSSAVPAFTATATERP